MPYVTKEERRPLMPPVKMVSDRIKTKGQLNYAITLLLHLQLKKKGLSYDNVSELYGVLHDAAAEYYRRVVAPYEDRKSRENGKIDILGKNEM